MGYTFKNESYNILINQAGGLELLVNELNPSQIIVLVDENTENFCLHYLISELHRPFKTISIRSGEANKNIDTCKFVWSSLIKFKADRKSLLINLGGGVIGDLGGFCAGTYMRGIDFIQMPTTLLSQVDASVGGKLGVDFDGFKNMVGLFQNPKAVIINTDFLKSLPYKELLSGYAELLKHGLIASQTVWEELSSVEDITTLDFDRIVHDSVMIKKTVTEEDPTEKGLRKILNFGHTIGHAVETLSFETDRPLLHGEAIAIGIILESHLSMQKGYISEEDYQNIKTAIIKLYGNKAKSLPTIEQITEIMLLDKKNDQGKIQFSLLNQIGQGNYNQEVDQEALQAALSDYIQ
ncbi:MAG TPA: 3-dehydroquinate synthase [Saprospiraceae bacterium]|nr:3-dehydroquinate synthase [Saprospiraceae bacterium]HPN70829.1 3-dehydroquinate synthase [Saprospiraceae bacterium]